MLYVHYEWLAEIFWCDSENTERVRVGFISLCSLTFFIKTRSSSVNVTIEQWLMGSKKISHWHFFCEIFLLFWSYVYLQELLQVSQLQQWRAISKAVKTAVIIFAIVVTWNSGLLKNIRPFFNYARRLWGGNSLTWLPRRPARERQDRQVVTKQECAESLFLVRGRDSGRPGWHYILVPYDNLARLRSQTRGSTIDVIHFGRILQYRDEGGQIRNASGWGDHPPEELSTWLGNNYGMK